MPSDHWPLCLLAVIPNGHHAYLLSYLTYCMVMFDGCHAIGHNAYQPSYISENSICLLHLLFEDFPSNIDHWVAFQMSKICLILAYIF